MPTAPALSLPSLDSSETNRILSAMERTLTLLERGERLRRYELGVLTLVCMIGIACAVSTFSAMRTIQADRDRLYTAIDTNNRLVMSQLAETGQIHEILGLADIVISADPPNPPPPQHPPHRIPTIIPFRTPDVRESAAADRSQDAGVPFLTP